MHFKKKKVYNSDDSQTKSPGKKKKVESKFILKKIFRRGNKKDYFDEEISDLRVATNNPNVLTPSRKEGLTRRSPVNKKRKLIFVKKAYINILLLKINPFQ